jgi:alkanesulfonate monooxygenase SsuD/methylene tetrahydromethanopterin reductase-like flavin-dependent oxidoreductase (luciferase family)
VEYVANLLGCDVDPAAWARQREDEGWDVLGCADHIFSPHRAYPHLWVTLATFAAATSRARLTSSFANNLFRSPVEFAQAALQMQAVSRGRFEAGLGAGWDPVETIGAGLDYPAAGPRAGRYAEAIRIVRELLDQGACALHGEHYDIEIPTLGPRTEPPPLVASLGGQRTIREIAPLVDRVELKMISAATKGGTLDVAALATIPRTHLVELVDRVRQVNPTVPLGVFVLCGVGTDARTRAAEELLGESFMGGFFGSAEKVAASIADLESAGVDRVQLSPFADAAFELLAPHLCGPQDT